MTTAVWPSTPRPSSIYNGVNEDQVPADFSLAEVLSSREGYRFTGWKDASGVFYPATADDPASVLPATMPASDDRATYYYAQWERTPVEYTVKHFYEAGDVTEIPDGVETRQIGDQTYYLYESTTGTALMGDYITCTDYTPKLDGYAPKPYYQGSGWMSNEDAVLENYYDLETYPVTFTLENGEGDMIGSYVYVYVDGIYLRRNWGGEFENVAILVAIAVNEDGYREVLGAAEGMKEDKASWVSFFQWLRSRGLDGVKLIVGDKCLGMLEAVGEVFPEAKYQRCTVHFYRNVFSVTPRSKVKLVAKMLKAIHAQESKRAAREKAKAVVEQLRSMKLKEAAKKVEDGIEETLTYCDFPGEHWTRIRTNNVIERLNREIRRRTRVVGSFPDGNSALMLVCARLRHVAGTQWGNKKYMNMKHLEAALEDASIAG